MDTGRVNTREVRVVHQSSSWQLAFYTMQLKEISADIKEIQENRQVQIEMKVDALSKLEDKVTLCKDKLMQISEVVLTLEKRIEENHSRHDHLRATGIRG